MSRRSGSDDNVVLPVPDLPRIKQCSPETLRRVGNQSDTVLQFLSGHADYVSRQGFNGVQVREVKLRQSLINCTRAIELQEEIYAAGEGLSFESNATKSNLSVSSCFFRQPIEFYAVHETAN